MIETKLPELHSPTSPASPHEEPSDLGAPPTVLPPATFSIPSLGASSAKRLARGGRGLETKKEEEGPGGGAINWAPTELIATSSPVENPGGPRRTRTNEPCPEVITGSKMDKLLKMVPNIWVKIGRQPKAAVCLNDPGVSRDQCSLKWDTYQKKVELRVDTPGGLMVNGAEIEETRSELRHGDRLRVQGKKAYEFVIDLRPVGLGFGDPKSVARDRAHEREDPEKRNIKMREQLHILEIQIKEQREISLQEDKEFYEVEMRRRLRQDNLAEKERLLQFYTEDAERLKEELEEKRQGWLARLEEEYQANQAVYEPLVQHVADLQEKLEKLQLKRDELIRSIHPDRYATADVAVMELPSPAVSSASRDVRGDESGEEDAFAGLSGLEDNREASDFEGPPVKSQPKAEAGDESTKVLKREGTDDPGEPAAKKPRQGGDGETWLCEERGANGAGGAEPGSSSAAAGLEGRVLD